MHSPTPSVVEPAWLTVNEVVRYTGVGRTSVYAACASGDLEARKAFGRTLISRASIDAYMARSPRLGAGA